MAQRVGAIGTERMPGTTRRGGQPVREADTGAGPAARRARVLWHGNATEAGGRAWRPFRSHRKHRRMTNGRPDSTSLWLGTSQETDYPQLTADTTADVCVVGGGITGLTAAYELTRAGARVVLLERWRVASGTTGNTTAKVSLLQGLVYQGIAEQSGEDAARDYAAANEAAQARIAAIVANEGIDCDLVRLPAYTWTEEPGQVEPVRREAEAAMTAGLAASFTEEVPLAWPTLGAVRLDHQVCFHPRRYCLALAERIVAGGGSIHEGTSALEVREDDGGVRVVAEAGEVRAGSVIIATLLPFHDPVGVFAKAKPSRSYALALRVEDPLPPGLLLTAEAPHRSLRPHVPANDEGYLIVEGEEHLPGEDPDASRHWDELAAYARSHFRVRSIDYRWSAQDYMTPDGMPYIGRAASDRVMIAAGFNKWGMTNGTLAGMLLADLSRGLEHAWLERFSPTRIGGLASLAPIAQQNLEVAREFVGARLPGGPDVTEIPPNQGAVVSRGLEKVAVFRRPDGTLQALSARCTHMGCIVGFNDAEQSWDCACHGSRFDLQGRVIEGPAGTDLAAVELEE
jgi:glycine/D-amino acid oxidase-like deaminating enzyme/nitrite reductase/ring-hydroxylating ferredoxin subunit